MVELVKYALFMAQNPEEKDDISFDTFSCLTFGHNYHFMKELAFCPGDGLMSYYLFNYQIKEPIPFSEIGAVLF